MGTVTLHVYELYGCGGNIYTRSKQANGRCPPNPEGMQQSISVRAVIEHPPVFSRAGDIEVLPHMHAGSGVRRHSLSALLEAPIPSGSVLFPWRQEHCHKQMLRWILGIGVIAGEELLFAGCPIFLHSGSPEASVLEHITTSEPGLYHSTVSGYATYVSQYNHASVTLRNDSLSPVKP